MNRERVLKVVLVLVGLIFLFAVYPLMMFLWPKRLALAAESAGIRADDPGRVCHARHFPTTGIP